MSERIAGVLGGMGPAATVHFMARVQALSGATRDQDHVRLIVDLNPRVPDRNAASAGAGESPGETLAAMTRGLASAGADFIVMPCNAAHAHAESIRTATSLPFVSLIDAAADAAVQSGGKRIGVLAAAACLEASLYQDALASRGLTAIVPDAQQQQRFMQTLYAIKAGDTGAAMRTAMRALAEALIDAGAEAVIAGCTEIPLVLGTDDIAVPLIDSTDVLALCTIAIARGAAP